MRNLTYDNILNFLDSEAEVNTYRPGYKYYLPKGLKLLNHEGSNEIFSYQDTIFYMYVDRVSYYNRIKHDFSETNQVFYSKKIENGDLFGYVQIKNIANEQYFLEIMYNYAKIEVMVDKDEINSALMYAVSILSSVSYQDEVLKNLLGEDSLKTNEIEFNIFESAETESEYLQMVEEYGQYEEKEGFVDPDFIHR